MTDKKQGFKPSKEELRAWLDKQIVCVISTLGETGFPNSATVAFSQNENLEFVIITDIHSRKAQNIARDERVAMTMTNEKDLYTLQLEGRARVLSWNEFERFSKHHYEKLPFSLPFKDIPTQAPVLITPEHARFSDINNHPWELTEII